MWPRRATVPENNTYGETSTEFRFENKWQTMYNLFSFRRQIVVQNVFAKLYLVIVWPGKIWTKGNRREITGIVSLKKRARMTSISKYVYICMTPKFRTRLDLLRLSVGIKSWNSWIQIQIKIRKISRSGSRSPEKNLNCKKAVVICKSWLWNVQ